MPSTRTRARRPRHELLGRPDPEVGGEQDLLDLVPGLLVDGLPAEQRQQAAAERVLRAGQPRAQSLQPTGRGLRDLDQQQPLEVLGRGHLEVALERGQLLDGGREGIPHLDDVDGAARGVARDRVVVPDAGGVVDAGPGCGGLDPPRPAAAAQRDTADDGDDEHHEGEGDVEKCGIHGRHPFTRENAPMNTLALLVAYGIVALLNVAGAASGNNTLANVTKPLLMLLLLAWLIERTRSSGGLDAALRWLAVGLGFAWLGDVLLMGAGDAFFLGGIAAFLVMQLCYLLAFTRVPGPGLVRAWRISVVPYALIWVSMNALVSAGVGALRVPVLVYSAVAVLMALAALDLVIRVPSAYGWRVAIGALVFVASDAILAMTAFGPLEESSMTDAVGDDHLHRGPGDDRDRPRRRRRREAGRYALTDSLSRSRWPITCVTPSPRIETP